METSPLMSRYLAVIAKGSLVSLLCRYPPQKGISSVQGMPGAVICSKTSFPTSSNELKPSKPAHPAYYPLWTSQHSAIRTSYSRKGEKCRTINFRCVQAWNTTDASSVLWKSVMQFSSVWRCNSYCLLYSTEVMNSSSGFSFAAGHFMPFNKCVTWDLWRLLVWRALSAPEREKHNFCYYKKPWSWLHSDNWNTQDVLRGNLLALKCIHQPADHRRWGFMLL